MIKISHKIYGNLLKDQYASFTVDGYNKSPLKLSWMKLYQAVRIAFETEILRERTTMLCYT